MNTNETDFLNLTPDILSEMETALGELTSEEKAQVDSMLDEYDSDELVDLLSWIKADDSDKDVYATEYYYSNPAPSTKVQPLVGIAPHRNVWYDQEGHLRVKNLSAWWIPELTITEEISGTVYTVTGSYEGTQSFLRKLERITAQNFTREMEGSE